MFRVVIPARYASTRLPGKLLRTIAGKPMIAHVYARARHSAAADVVIATDDARIAIACRDFGATCVMTAASHESGTDRIAEVAALEHWNDDDIVVNVQGDEPLIPPALIDQVAALLAHHPGAAIATVATPIEALAEFLDPNVVKVVADRTGRALYFSRAPVPWVRDGMVPGADGQSRFDGALRHVGLYAYRVKALQRLASLPPSPLELAEKLEQLRALEEGLTIVVAVAAERPGPGVDTEEDLRQVARLL